VVVVDGRAARRGKARRGNGGRRVARVAERVVGVEVEIQGQAGAWFGIYLREKRLVSESEDVDGGQCHGKAREPHMKDRNLAPVVKSGDLLIRGTYQEQSAGQAT